MFDSSFIENQFFLKDFISEPVKFLGIQNGILIFSFLSHLAISARIKLLKKKSLQQVHLATIAGPQLNLSDAETTKAELLYNKKKTMLVDTTVIAIFFVVIPFIYSYSRANQVQALPVSIDKYPYYLMIYLYHFVMPLTALFSFIFLFYYRNPQVLSHILRELNGKFQIQIFE